ncbi:hypothetical protein F441_18862 [Phytophthora nicotianae CJ01A1]|uniref:Uncharacterized protein n=2 Tax=Phytophthora nicotianae TaxID=4792 RepID=W2QW51_PHYN3|nr:hypothetical protein PPTG_21644 [Phytophthora nicotianae INRA-310]ETN17343.1 hypothetical protein PPTG_21644 [Phytophthora nicotianae INRA-310]ETP04343.1 hypothetical protein F441_18862 [Phytophthora nicotianae CJ01A1]
MTLLRGTLHVTTCTGPSFKWLGNSVVTTVPKMTAEALTTVKATSTSMETLDDIVIED